MKLDIFSLLDEKEDLFTSDMPHLLNCIKYWLCNYYISFTARKRDDHVIDTNRLAEFFKMKDHPCWNSAPNFKQITDYSLKIFSKEHVNALAYEKDYW